MTLLGRGFDDLLLDNLVTILTAYVTAQKAAYLAVHPGASAQDIQEAVGFTAERDRLAAPNDSELANGPIVSIYATMGNPSQGGPSRDNDQQTLTVQIDHYVASGEQLAGGGDKLAMARLYYLKDQVRDAMFAKANFDLGFAQGVCGSRKWGRWQVTPQPVEGEAWTISGSWSFDLDYSFTPQDLTMLDLNIVSVNVDKDNAQAPTYKTRWSGLYTVQGGP